MVHHCVTLPVLAGCRSSPVSLRARWMLVLLHRAGKCGLSLDITSIAADVVISTTAFSGATNAVRYTGLGDRPVGSGAQILLTSQDKANVTVDGCSFSNNSLTSSNSERCGPCVCR